MIAEHLTVLRGVFENYKKYPTWDKLQIMFQTTLRLGIELGKKEARINRSLT